MFGIKSFSDRAKRDAIFYLRDIDDNIRRYLVCLPPKFHEELQLRNCNLPLADPVNLESTKKLNEFNVGVVQTLLDFFFDGSAAQREVFYKSCIADAFNVRPSPQDGVAKRAGYTAAWALGMTNLGTDYYKSFKKTRQIISVYLREGCHWAESAFIPHIVKEGRLIEDLEYEFKPMLYAVGQTAPIDAAPVRHTGFRPDTMLRRQPILDLKEVDYCNSERFAQLLSAASDERFKHYSKLWQKDLGYEREANEYISEQRQSGEFELARDFCVASLIGTDCWGDSIGKLDRFETIFRVCRAIGLNPEIAIQMPDGKLSETGEQILSDKSFFKMREFLQVSGNTFFLTEMDDDPLEGIRLHWAKNYTGKVLCKIPSDAHTGLAKEIIFDTSIAVRPLDIKLFYENDLNEADQTVFNAVLLNDYSSFFAQAKKYPSVEGKSWYQKEKARLTTAAPDMFDHYQSLLDQVPLSEAQDLVANLPLTLTVESQINLPVSHEGLHELRLDSFDKIGSYFDDFDHHVIAKLVEAGIEFDADTVDGAEKITPSAVSLALKLERILAPYLYRQEKLRKFTRLLVPLDDHSSLNLDI